MRLRDAVEDVVRSWDAYERARGGRAVIDYDCAPPDQPVEPASSRLEVFDRLTALHEQAEVDGNDTVFRTLRAHLAYVSGVLGQRPPLDEYLRATQGCPAGGWPEDYILAVGEQARKALTDLGVDWGPNTGDDLKVVEEPIDLHQARAQIQAVAGEVEPTLRELTGANAQFTVEIEVVDVDDYWAYWLDGAGSQARMRFNLRHADFTTTRLHQFAQHELLGHALQCASFAHVAAREDVEWVRTLTVHLPYQTLLEGLATALPLFTTPDDVRLMARIRLTHYLHLVRAELHRAINDGSGIRDCAEHARARAPWLKPNEIGDTLTDRGTDPLLRSYLWAYPAGTDWFINLADHADPDTTRTVLRAAYQRPLTPADLTDLWPGERPVGGPGAPVVLRRPRG